MTDNDVTTEQMEQALFDLDAAIAEDRELTLKSSTEFTIKSTCYYDIAGALTCGFCGKRYDAPISYCVAAAEPGNGDLLPICKDCTTDRGGPDLPAWELSEHLTQLDMILSDATDEITLNWIAHNVETITTRAISVRRRTLEHDW